MSCGTLPMQRYHRAEALGSGSFGSVVTVYDCDGNECALKVFDETASDEDSADASMSLGTLRELSILRLLRGDNGHGSIVEMLDVQPASAEGFISMAMPLFRCGDLARALEGRALPAGRAGAGKRKAIAHGLLEALDYLHHNHIIHRDVKSANVMLTDEMRPVLIDFSCAKICDGPMAVLPPGSTHTGEVGTAAYTAPEVVARKPYGAKADMWSAGVVLLEVLRGACLRVDRDKAALRLIEETKASLPDKPFANMVRSLLVVDCEGRNDASQALLSEVFTAAGHLRQTPGTVIFSTGAAASENENLCSTSNKKRKGGGQDDELARAVKKLCSELDCENPNTAKAAYAYARRLLARRRLHAAEMKEESALLHCAVLAEKFFEVEGRDLEELHNDDEAYPSFFKWDLEEYAAIEAEILSASDYCLYISEGEVACFRSTGSSAGRKKKKPAPNKVK